MLSITRLEYFISYFYFIIYIIHAQMFFPLGHREPLSPANKNMPPASNEGACYWVFLHCVGVSMRMRRNALGCALLCLCLCVCVCVCVCVRVPGVSPANDSMPPRQMLVRDI